MNHFIRTNRIASLGIALAVFLVGYLLFHSPAASAQTRYVLGSVEKGTLTVAISGTGQVQASDQIDVKPKASAQVTSVLVAAGQRVAAGQVLAYLDAQDAQQSVKNAQIALDNATITLQKLQRSQTIDATTAQSDLDQAYVDALNTVASAFLKLPTLVDTARSVLYDDTLKGSCSPNACEYGNLVSDDTHDDYLAAVARAKDDYTAARAAYDTTFADYRMLRSDASSAQITSMVDATKRVATLFAQAVKSEKNLLDLVVDDIDTQAAKNGVTARVPAPVTSYQSSIGAAIGDLNTMGSQLLSSQRSILNDQQTLENASLTDPLDLASQQNAVVQRQQDLRNAQQDLADHTIRSPIAGTVAAVNVKRGDSASSGTAIATVISDKQLAVIPLNETDITAVQLKQKATITFDAIEDLTMTGTVVQVDVLGTASQGVVNYNVTIALDTQDARVRSGMSMTANIITKTVQNALLVPSSAVKTLNGTATVQTIDGATNEQVAAIGGIVSATAPRSIPVTTGASNDTMTEVTAGLNEGDIIVTRTISSSSAAATTTSSGNRAMFGGGGGGEIRMITR